jgi:hypothetical protein
MSCSQYTALHDALAQYEFADAISCTFTEPAGTLVTGMLVFGALTTSLGIRTDGIAMPAAITLLTGGILLPFLPGAATQIATVILLVVVGIGPVIMLRRLS